MTPLRQRMIDDMRIRSFSPNTIDQYTGRVAQLAKYYGRSPDKLGPEEVRAYQVHLTEKHVHWGRILGRLRATDRQILMDFYSREMSVSEMAAGAGRSLEAVRSKLKRSLREAKRRAKRAKN